MKRREGGRFSLFKRLGPWLKVWVYLVDQTRYIGASTLLEKSFV